jgi:hypothetical protein
MPTTQSMIQFLTEQFTDSEVSEVYGIDDEAFLFLDPSRNTVVREIASQEVGGIVATKAPDGLSIGFSSKALTELRLVQPRGDADAYFYAPSFNPSAPVKGFGLAILRVREFGISVTNDARLSVGRAIGAHAYVDQTD